jgi:predicted ATPase
MSPLIWQNLVKSRFIQLDRVQLGEPSDKTDTGDLAADASNLPTVLAELPDHVLGTIRAMLVFLVPGIASFEVVGDKDAFHIEFTLSGGERLPAHLISDGTLRVLALLTALNIEPRPHLISIEEPENGIFPARLRGLLDLLREFSARRPDEEDLRAYLAEEYPGVRGVETNQLPVQILVTTHSPVILSALRKRPAHLRFVDMLRRNGERITRARPVGHVSNAAASRYTASPREIELVLEASMGEDSE